MFVQDKVQEINEKLLVLKDVTNIVIWGAGVHTAKLFEKTNLFKYHIEYIVDMDKQKQGNTYFGFNIKNPDDIEWCSVKAVVISVPGKAEQIANLLTNEFKCSGKIVSLYEKKNDTPFYKLYDKGTMPIVYEGDYKNWNEAALECSGYGDKNILTKVADSINKVILGEAVWERDSSVFFEQKFVYRICASILRCAIQNDNKGVNVLDIGGSLGSTYFQNAKYLAEVNNLHYVVAEQVNFAEYGHKNLENEVLKFVNSEVDYNCFGKWDIVLMSASLQYIYPYKKVVSKVLDAKPHYIILDRVLVGNRKRICKQIVPARICSSSYPVIVFDESTIYQLFESDYKMLETDLSSVPEEAYFEDDIANSRYYVFERRSWE